MKIMFPENKGKMTVNEEIVLVCKYKNNIILGNNELVQHIIH